MALEFVRTGVDQRFNFIVFQGANLLASGLDFVTSQVDWFTHIVVLVGPLIERCDAAFLVFAVAGFSKTALNGESSVVWKHRIWIEQTEEFVQDPTHLFDVLVAELSVSGVIKVANGSFLKVRLSTR